MIKRRQLLSSLDYFFSSSINIGNEKILKVITKGHIEIPTKIGNMKIKGIYYAPHLKHSFSSVEKMHEKNYKLVV